MDSIHRLNVWLDLSQNYRRTNYSITSIDESPEILIGVLFPLITEKKVDEDWVK